MPAKGSHIDLKGQKFGRLTVIKFMGTRGRRRTYWQCICDCGNKCYIDTSHLRSGHSKSCGCINKEKIGNLRKKTGLSSTKLYYKYRNMINRCYYEKSDMYSLYGGRGIKVCDEWLSKNNGFENFSKWALSNGYSENLSLDRIDNNKGYSPKNCRWVDIYAQANNKRNIRYLQINGEIDTVGNFARKLHLNYWNLLHYSKGGKNCKYPNLQIKAVNNGL